MSRQAAASLLLFATLAALPILFIHCGGGTHDLSDTGIPDEGRDTSVDTGFDAGIDSGTDIDDDAYSPHADGGFDAGKDSGFDAGHEDASDTGWDGGADAGWDAGPDCGDAGIKICNSSICPKGCCDPCGTCRTGMENSACGGDGLPCHNCISRTDDRVCYAQTCFPCSSLSCKNGCCSDDRKCKVGTGDQFCGTNGNACLDCGASSLVCVGRQCGVCSPATCPSGCCDSTGHCLSGTANDDCGTGGAGCSDCKTATTQMVCTGNACTCSGVQMCVQSGVCVNGDDDAHCGYSGVACVNCWNYGEYCSGGMCWSSGK